MPKPVMIIVPMQNGFVLMPFDSDLLFSIKKGTISMRVATDVDGLKANIEAVYGPPDEGESKGTDE